MMFTFFVFDHKYPSVGNLVKKIQNCSKTNSNMQNSVVVCILSVLDWKQLPFLNKSDPNKNCQFKLKIGT